MIESFFFNSNHIILLSIFYLYFWSILQNDAEVCFFYLQKIKNQLEAKVTLVVCVNTTCCHKLPYMLIGKYNRQHALQTKHVLSNTLHKSVPDGHSNMLEFGQWGILFWCSQKNLSPSSFAYGQYSRVFWPISKGECF